MSGKISTYSIELQGTSFLYIPARQKILEYLFQIDYFMSSNTSDEPIEFFGPIKNTESAVEAICEEFSELKSETVVLWDARDVCFSSHHSYKHMFKVLLICPRFMVQEQC